MDRTQNIRPLSFWCRISACVLVCLLALLAPAAQATDNLCGATILSNLRLDHDLSCAGNGLVVGADGIRISLNGYTIAGSGTAAGGLGISVIGRTHVSIVGGIVKNFQTAVRVMNSSDVVIKDNELSGNGEGIDLQAGSIGNTIKENTFLDSTIRAVMLRGGVTDNVIKENSFGRNRVGILIFAGVDNTIKENIISDSTLAGIRVNVFATGNLIAENTITYNPAGVEFLVTATGSAIGNSLVENRIGMNACGIKGPFDGNSFNENVFQSNGVDICP
ncbi:MAG TPA: NosD domain-containing protein [Vicinamibacterales bacterium]|nr:NosD domain-containing protein [Vicinamibacterales bacterium]